MRAPSFGEVSAVARRARRAHGPRCGKISVIESAPHRNQGQHGSITLRAYVSSGGRDHRESVHSANTSAHDKNSAPDKNG